MADFEGDANAHRGVLIERDGRNRKENDGKSVTEIRSKQKKMHTFLIGIDEAVIEITV